MTKTNDFIEEDFDVEDGQSRPEALTSWSKEPSLHELLIDYNAAEPAHKAQVAKVAGWAALIEVSGKEAAPVIKGRSRVQPRLIRRQNEWRYSALSEPFLGTDKLFEVRPRTHEDKPASVQNEHLLNYQFRTYLDVQNLIDQYIRITTDEGTGLLRPGWKRVEEEVEEEVTNFDMYPVQDEETAQMIVQAAEMEKADPGAYRVLGEDVRASAEHYNETGEFAQAVATGTTKRKVTKVTANHPTLDILDYRNVRIDPSCGADFEKARFYTHSFETNIADLHKAGIYKNLDKLHHVQADPATDTQHTNQTPDPSYQFSDKARRLMVAVEYWGFRDVHGDGKLTPIVATWIGDVLIRMEENPFPDRKLNLVPVPYMPTKRSVWGETDAELLADYQRIQGGLWRGAIDLIAKSSNSQTGIAIGMLDPVNRARFDQGLTYEFNPNIHPQNGVYTHTFPDLPSSVLSLLNVTNQESEAMTGVKSFHGGMSGEGLGKVAAGIRGMLDASSKREMAILRRLSSGLVKAATKIMAMNAVFLSEEEVVRITADQYITVRRDELAGQFDLIIDISTAEVDDAQAQQLAFMLQTMGPNMGTEYIKMILAEIARLKRMPDLERKIKEYEPQPDPLAEAMKELEIAKIQAEVARLNAQTALYEAQAKKATAEAEATDLDYVNDVEGTTQERNMELATAQGRSNMDNLIAKSLVEPEKEGTRRAEPDAALGFRRLVDDERNAARATSGAPLVSGSAIGTSVPEEMQPLPEDDASLSINSAQFDPELDPALNPALNM